MTFFYVREKATKQPNTPKGVQSGAPHLYTSRGKAEARRKGLWKPDLYEVVEVQLTEINPQPST